MTSVGLLTVHQSVNCGASLQAAALYRSIKELGGEPTVIDYRPRYFLSYMDEANSGARRSLKGRAKTFLIGRRLSKTMNEFKIFANENYPNATQPFSTRGAIEASGIDFDVFLCGSDQIWNPEHVDYDRTWLLDFDNSKDSVKASYAASIGKDKLSEKDKGWLKSGIVDFAHVSVRESAGVDVLAQLGIEAVQCLDPTLLRPKAEWLHQSVGLNRSLPDKYIFYYPIEENELESQMLSVLKRRTGLPCVALTDSFRRPRHCDIQITGFGPAQFLYLIKKSDMVFTNSFHGLVFSLLFEKLLVSYRNNTKNSRLESLFDLLGLPGYQVTDPESLGELDLDFERDRFIESYGNIASEIEFSRDYLASIFERA